MPKKKVKNKEMVIKFKPFWRERIGSIQEPYPHHTVLCLKCGYLYTRKAKFSLRCPKCNHVFNQKNTKKTEFWVRPEKKEIVTGKNLENRRKNNTKA